jgi:ATP-dependent Clp protease ATP-binding subunit ClpC
LFGDEDRLIQVDMSEFMEMHSVSKLIGSPPGYVGYTEGGQLTERVRRQPHSVILFDEIEKAHVDVLNLLLQILEYGHLTDGKGRTVNFKNTVIILTSNIGASEIRKDSVLGFDSRADEDKKTKKDIENAYDSMKETLNKELKDTLPPELLNRMDDVIIFRSLTKADAELIVDLLIDELNQRLEDQGIQVSADKKAKKYIVKHGFSEEYGARPIRRVIQDALETAVASYILQYGGGVVWKGQSVEKSNRKKKLKATVSGKGDKLTISKAK